MRKAPLTAIAAGMLASSAAQAELSFNCESGCHFTEEALQYINYRLPIDYTVPDDGKTYKWTFTLDRSDALFQLDAPTQVEEDFWYRNGDFRQNFNRDFFRFDQTVRPGITTILVSAPAYFYVCDDPSYSGDLCGHLAIVYGNGTTGLFSGFTGDVTLTTKIEAVPEPATWALLFLGFGAIGLASRSRRRAEPAPAA